MPQHLQFLGPLFNHKFGYQLLQASLIRLIMVQLAALLPRIDVFHGHRISLIFLGPLDERDIERAPRKQAICQCSIPLLSPHLRRLTTPRLEMLSPMVAPNQRSKPGWSLADRASGPVALQGCYPRLYLHSTERQHNLLEVENWLIFHSRQIFINKLIKQSQITLYIPQNYNN